MEAAVIILICVLFIRWLFLRDRLNRMEQRIEQVAFESASAQLLRDLTHRVWLLERGSAPAPQPAPLREPEPQPIIEQPAPPEPEPELAPQPPAPTPPAWRSDEWEAWVGTSLLNKVGALVLVIAIALSLSYGFMHVGPAGRAATALLVSLILLGSGVWIERRAKYQVFARGLIGAGWAALYATSYAIWALPAARIIENPYLGSLGMLAVAAGMIWHSLKYRVQAITSIAYFTAFAALRATPSTPFAAVSLIPLSASLLYLANRFNWFTMGLFGLAGTWLTCVSRGDTGAPLFASQSLFLAYWALFEGFDLLRARKGVAGGGVEWIFPVNALCFLGLSGLAWSNHAHAQMWLAATFGAALFLGSALLRLFLRAGRYEAPAVICAVLAGLAIVGKVPGVWTSAALAAEAEIIYLAGVRFRAPFLQAFGGFAFTISLGRLIWHALSGSAKSPVLGHETWNWTPPALLHAAFFYLNRVLDRTRFVFSFAAALILAAMLAAEVPERFVGTAWLALGAIYFELGVRRRLLEFRVQAYILAAMGLMAAIAVNSRESLALALGITYAQSLRTQSLEDDEKRNAAFGTAFASALYAALLLWRIVPADSLALSWILLALACFELGVMKLPEELRFAAYPLAAAAFCAAIFRNVEPPQLAQSLPIGGLFFLAQFLAARSERLFSQLASLLGTGLLMAVLFAKVSGGWLTAAWGFEGLALLAAGFAVRTRLLRLEGLVLLLICVLKLFLYDLRNLETIYRILSFAVLGLIMLGVSWVYTRFREKLRNYF